MNVIRRARPSLGSIVELRVEGLSDDRAVAAIDSAFAEIETIHRRMSFHEHDSDLSRLHRAHPRAPVHVDARTYEVLACAIDIARMSEGIFDPTIAALQVARVFLPRPALSRTPDPHADWRDIELLGDNHVRFARPLWIDLGGIAKGYAVDRAMNILIAAGASHACVNAGGDMRVHGSRMERIDVRVDTVGEVFHTLEIHNASVASSEGFSSRNERGGVHIDGRTRNSANATRCVSVIAPTCMIADALTKVVMSGDDATIRNVLSRFSAQACIHDPRSGWRVLDQAA